MSAAPDRLTVQHDGVTIPVSRGGRGRPLVLCPGLLTTQADLLELTGLLRRDHEVVTFDLRGHGLTSAGAGYSFEAFLGDLTAVLAALPRLGLSSAPVLVGHSLGADLVVHHAAEHPGTVAELVLVDGANPVPEPFITEADLPEFAAMADELAHEAERARGTARRVSLTAADILALNLEVEVVRSGILERYRRIDRPITMIMSASMAGDSGEGRAAWRNRNWRAGVERLVDELPGITTFWLDAGHGSVLTAAPDIARIVRTAGRLTRC
jgi:esterase